MFGHRFFGLTGTALQFAICAVAGIDFVLFGYNQGVMSSLLTEPTFTNSFPQTNILAGTTIGQRYHFANVQGIAVACLNAGCFIGALFTIFISDWLGRRKTIFLGTLIMVIGAAIQCSAFSLAQMIAGRTIIGFGNGMNTSTVPTWQSETSKSHRRGQLILIESACIAGGTCISTWVNFGFAYTQASDIAWRFPIGLQIVFGLIVLVLILPLPESPRWLILQGMEDEALTVLAALNDVPPNDPSVHGEFMAIKDTILEMTRGGVNDLFSSDKDRHFHRTVLAYLVQALHQLCGINLLTYYAATIYQTQLKRSPFVARLLAACNMTEYFLAGCVAVFVIDRFGRRMLTVFGSAGMCLCFIILAIMTSIGHNAENIAATVFLFLLTTFFALGWLGIGWLYPAEIVPLRIRGPANALACSANWLFNFMVVMITPVCFTRIGYRTWIIFAVINAAVIPIIYLLYPETAYRSLEEMDTIFRKTTGWLQVVDVARREPRRYNNAGEPLINYIDTEEHARRLAAAATRGFHPRGRYQEIASESIISDESAAEKGHSGVPRMKTTLRGGDDERMRYSRETPR